MAQCGALKGSVKRAEKIECQACFQLYKDELEMRFHECPASLLVESQQKSTDKRRGPGWQ